MLETVSAKMWTVCKVGDQAKFGTVCREGCIVHCFTHFVSRVGSPGTNGSGGEFRRGDKAATSCRNERSEARWVRSRIQGRTGKGPGPSKRHIHLARGCWGPDLAAVLKAKKHVGFCGRGPFSQHKALAKIWGNFRRGS